MRNKTAYYGVFIALALIISYVELQIPIYFGVPGIKLGLANIVILLMLYCFGTKEALMLSVGRICLVGFLFGNLYSIIYSLAGGLLSLVMMALLKKSKIFSVVGVSIAGGIAHNIGQMVIAMLTVETWNIAYYMPVLLVAGTLTGMLVGIVAAEVLKRLP